MLCVNWTISNWEKHSITNLRILLFSIRKGPTKKSPLIYSSRNIKRRLSPPFLYLVRATGLDLIKDRLGPALAGGARPRRIEWVQVLSVHAEIKKERPFGLSFLIWCGRQDLNLHASRHMSLNHTCLPIPPRPHISLFAWVVFVGAVCDRPRTNTVRPYIHSLIMLSIFCCLFFENHSSGFVGTSTGTNI